jgi:hypothetical protein
MNGFTILNQIAKCFGVWEGSGNARWKQIDLAADFGESQVSVPRETWKNE